MINRSSKNFPRIIPVLSFYIVLGIAFLLAAFVDVDSAEAASTPFVCDGTVFISRGDSTSSTLFAVDSSTDPFTLNALTGAETFSYNSIGFNIIDGLIYAHVRSTNDIHSNGDFMSIDAAGNVINYGPPDIGPLTYAGDTDEFGVYYIVSGDDIYAYDTTDPNFPTLKAGYPVTVDLTGIGPNMGADIAYSPSDGFMYGMRNKLLIKIDVVTGDTTPITITGDVPTANAFGAMWFDARGVLFGYQNNLGIYEIDIATGASDFVSTAATVSTNDGTGCAYAPVIEKTVTPAQTIPGQTVTWNFEVTNGMQFTTMTVGISDTLPAGFTFVANTLAINGANVDGTPNAYAGTDTLDIDGIELPDGGTVTISIDALVSYDATGGTYYNQAILTDLLTGFGGSKLSDFPPTAENGDPTPVEIIASAEIDLDKSLLSNADGDGSLTVSEGDLLTYQFVVTNTGAVRLRNVVITDTLTGVGPLDCTPATPVDLLPFETVVCSAEYTATSDDVNAGAINNSAVVVAQDPAGDDVFDEDTEAVPIPQVPSIKLDKNLDGYTDADGSTSVTENDTLNYTLTITNDGNVTLYGVAVTDVSAIVGVCTPAQPQDLDPGETMSCPASHVVTSADMLAGDYINTATATGKDTNGNDVSDEDSQYAITPYDPSIELDKSLRSNADEDGSGNVSVDDTLTYQFVATNTGDGILTDVEITDPLAGLSALSCSPAQPVDLAETETLRCSATYVVMQADVDNGIITNTATLIATPIFGPNLQDIDLATVPIAQTPSIDLDKSVSNNTDGDGSGTVTEDDILTYRFEVTNNGNVTLDNVTVSDPMAGLYNWSCSPALGSSINPDDQMICTAKYKVTLADVNAGNITNEASATGDDPNNNPILDNDKEVTETDQQPAISLDKKYTLNDDLDGGGTVTINDTLSYQLTSENTGNTTLTNVTITDTLVSIAGTDCAPNMPASLEPGEKMICTVTYQVQQSDVDFGKVVNKAVAEGTDPKGGQETDSDVEGVTTPQNPSILFDKSRIGSGDVVLNEVVTYKFEAINNGNVTLSNAVISDTLVGMSPLNCTPSMPVDLEPTDTLTCTSTYTITQTDVDNGTVYNTATVTATDPTDNEITEDDEQAVVANQVPSIAVDKYLLTSEDVDNSTSFSEGDILTYTFDIENDGSVTLFNVTLTDPLISVVSCTPAQGSSLAPAATMSCTGRYVASAVDETNGQVVNVATASSTDQTGNVVKDNDTETVPTADEALIDLQKAMTFNNDVDANGLPTIGDTLTYVFTATNSGLLALNSVEIIDPLPNLSVLVCNVPTPTVLTAGEQLTCQATYVIDQADANSGQIANTATVTAKDPFNNDVTDSALETVPVVQGIDLKLDKSIINVNDADGSTDISLNDVLTYQFVATNDGFEALSNVEIIDPLPGLGALNCVPVAQPTTLQYTEVLTCTALYTVTQDDIDQGIIKNTATVTGTSPSGETVTNLDSEYTNTQVQEPAMVLTKTATAVDDVDGSTHTTVGDIVTYVFTATNSGNVTLFDSVITDTLPGLSPLSCNTAMPVHLAPDNSIICTATYEVQQSDADNGSVDNTAYASGESPAGDDITAEDTETIPTFQDPSIALIKELLINGDEDGSTTVTISDTLTYVFTATNDGFQTLNNVTISDTMAGLSALSCSISDPVTLLPDETLRCTATYEVTQQNVDDGVINNNASTSGITPSDIEVTDAAVESVPTEQIPSIKLDKSAEYDELTLTFGETVTYTFVVTNDGNVTLSNVVVTDTLSGLSAIACNPSSGATLAPGATMNCSATYVVTLADVNEGDIMNTASVSAKDPQKGDVIDGDNETVKPNQAPNIELLKEYTGNSGGADLSSISVGDFLTYTFVATNTGNTTLTAVGIVDPLPNLSSISCLPTDLDPTDVITCTATYEVTQAHIDRGLITNTATVTGTAPITTVVDSSLENVFIPQLPSIEIDKSMSDYVDVDDSADITVNDVLTYTFTITNDGNVTLDAVSVEDPLTDLSAISCSPSDGSSLAPNAVMTCSATYVVKQADVDEGDIYNEATVSSVAPDGSKPEDSDTETTDTVAADPSIVLDKTMSSYDDVDGSTDISLNDVLTYTFVVTNDGNVTLSDVDVVDPMVGLSDLACTPTLTTTLSPNQSATCTATYKVTQANVNAGTVDNTATASGIDPNDTDVDDMGMSSVLVPQTNAIAFDKTFSDYTDVDGLGPISLNDILTYTFVATNTGNTTLSDVSIEDLLPGLYDMTCDPLQPATLGPDKSIVCTALLLVKQTHVDSGTFTNTATVSATPPLTDTISESDDAVVTVPQNPSIVLDKTVDYDPLTLTKDDTITYTFTITNDGDTTLQNVVVTDTLPGLSAISCPAVPVGGFAPDATLVCEATYAVTQADVDAAEIVNNASVSADSPTGPVDFSDTETAYPAQLPKIALDKAMSGYIDNDESTALSFGDIVTYTFTITNEGNLTISNAQLTDPLDGLVMGLCDPTAPATLSPADVMTCSATYEVDQADVDAGIITNTATISGTLPNNATIGDSDTEEVEVPRNPAIALDKSVDYDPATLKLNDIIDYTILVTNTGDTSLSNIVVTDTLPGLSPIVCVPALSGGLLPDAVSICTATYQISQADVDAAEVVNFASVSADSPTISVGANDSETAKPVQAPKIELDKTMSGYVENDGSMTISLGDVLTYTFTITNEGNLTISNTQLTDPLPGLTFGTCSPAQPATLAPTAQMVCFATYEVLQADVDAGVITNTATISGTLPNGAGISDTDDEETEIPRDSSIVMEKSADYDPLTLKLDDIITYTIVVTNDGNTSLSNIVISDTLPGLSPLTCSPVMTTTLLPSEEMSCTATYQITQADVNTSVVVNDASVSADSPTGPVEDDASVPVSPIQLPAIAIDKVQTDNADNDKSSTISLGDVLTYTFTITNEGNLTISNTQLSDPLPGLTFGACDPAQPATLIPTDVMVCFATYEVLQADVDAGVITNTATITGTLPSGALIDDSDTEVVEIPRDSSIVMAKSADYNPLTLNLNDIITYTIVVTNNGNTSLSNIVISDTLPGLSPLTCTPVMTTTLLPTEKMTCMATYQITQADVNASVVVNDASVSADSPTGPVKDDASVPVSPIQLPAIAIDKVQTGNADNDKSSTISLGDVLTYTFTITNEGNLTISNTQLTDVLAGISMNGCSPAEPATLNPTDIMVCTANYTVLQSDVDAGVITNTATISGTLPNDSPIGESDTEVVEIPRDSSIVMAKSAEYDPTTLNLNDIITYTIVVTNDGNTSLSNIVISDTLPGLSPLTCTPVMTTTLLPSEKMTCTATYQITQADVNASVVVNDASVSAESPTGPVEDDASVNVPPVQQPSIDLDKAQTGNADNDESSTISLGDVLTYTFTITNDGNLTISNTQLSDPLPGLTFGACDPAQPATLIPADVMVCFATYEVLQGDVDAGVITNTATITGTLPGGALVDDSDTELVEIPRDSSIAMAKSAEYDPSTLNLNDIITYTIVVTNDGNTTLNNIVISDTLPGLSPLTCTPAMTVTLLPTEKITCLATYQITQADVNASVVVNNASVSADSPTGPVENDASVNVPPVQEPAIVLDKEQTGNADNDKSDTISLGDVLTYTFTITNEGNLTISNTQLSDPLEGITISGCSPMQPAQLYPTDNMVCWANYTVLQSDVDAGVITNTATISGTLPNGSPIGNSDTEVVEIPRNPAVVMDKSADYDPATLNLNDIVTYTIVVTNSGNTSLSNIVVSDPLPGLNPLTCTPVMTTTLLPSETMTCTATYQITQADVDASLIVNNAGVSAESPTVPVTSTATTTVLPVQQPSIALDKAMSGYTNNDETTTISLGDVLTYTFTITNDGNLTISNTQLTDPLAGLAFGVCNPAQPATLIPTGIMVCSATYEVLQSDVDAGVITNTATISGTLPNGSAVDNSDTEVVEIPRNPSVIMDKSAEYDPSTLNLNDIITYTIVVTNNGNTSLNNIVISDTLPGLNPLTCTPVMTTTLLPSEKMTCTATYQITQANVDASVVVNNASVSAESPTGPVEDTASVAVPPVQQSAIALDKVQTGNADNDESGTVSLGDVLTYTFTITNEGNLTISNTQLSDPLAGITINGCSPLQPARLYPGDKMVCSANYIVVQSDVDAGVITNTATISGTLPNGSPIENSDTEVVEIPRNPSVIMDKSAEYDPSTLNLNDIITYTIVVTNNGNTSLSNIVISDTLPGLSPLTCTPAMTVTLLPAENITCSATYQITQADVDNSVVTNNATVSAESPTGPVEDNASVNVPPVQEAAIEFSKAIAGYQDIDDSSAISLNDILTYTFTITNEGNLTVSGIELNDPLPNLVFNGCEPALPVTLIPNAVALCSANYTITQADVDAGLLTNAATISGTLPNTGIITDTAEVTVEIPQNPSIVLDKSAEFNADELTFSDVVTYTLVMTNNGDVTLTNVVVTDIMEGLSALSCSPALSETMAVQTTKTCTATYVVTQADVDAGYIVNTASVSADSLLGPVLANSSVIVPPVQSPNLLLNKTMSDYADHDESGTISLDDVLTYKFVIQNAGNVTISNTQLVDPLPNLSAISCTPSLPVTLAPGEFVTCFANYLVTQDNVDAGAINNTAVASGYLPDGSPSVSPDTAVTPIPQAPNLSMDKIISATADEDGSETLSLGDTITYSIYVTNTGNTTLDDVKIIDPMPGLSELICSVPQPSPLAPGESMYCSATYVVTPQDAALGTVVNTAVATNTSHSSITPTDTVNTIIESETTAVTVAQQGADNGTNPLLIMTPMAILLGAVTGLALAKTKPWKRANRG